VNHLSVTSSETSASLAAIVEDVGGEVPGYRKRTSPDGMLTVAFTDIEGSTAMMERIGEARWMAVIFIHNRIVRECVRRHGGDVIKSQGDGFMVTFSSASAALDWAVALQQQLARYNAGETIAPLHVRVGMHTGNIFQADEDFLGKAVVLAARITGRARGDEILVSAASREYTEHLGRWTYGRPMQLRLKGLTRVECVYSLDWAPSTTQ
jgi:class 3 adenylate cyclase